MLQTEQQFLMSPRRSSVRQVYLARDIEEEEKKTHVNAASRKQFFHFFFNHHKELRSYWLLLKTHSFT